MKEDLRFEKIERYLLDRLPEEERRTFEAEIAADPELAKQVAGQRKEHEMMEALVEKRLRNKLAQWEMEAENSPDTGAPENGRHPGFPLRVRLLIGGLVLIAIGVIVTQIIIHFFPAPAPPPTSQQPQKEQPVKQEQQIQPARPLVDTPPLPPAGRPDKTQYIALARRYLGNFDFAGEILQRSDEGASTLKDALTALSDRRFREGIALLRSIPDDAAQYWDAQFYLGLAFLEQEKPEAAVPYLSSVAGQTGNLLSESAEWYLALAYLHQGNRDRCESTLRRISGDSQHPYYEKARNLENALKTVQ